MKIGSTEYLNLQKEIKVENKMDKYESYCYNVCLFVTSGVDELDSFLNTQTAEEIFKMGYGFNINTPELNNYKVIADKLMDAYINSPYNFTS